MAEYIKRERVVDVLVDMETLALYEDAIPAIKNIRRLIDGIPAADVKPVRHGHDTGESRYFHCSMCDYGVSDVFEDGPVLVFEKGKEWGYCPNCGAKMDKEKE